LEDYFVECGQRVEEWSLMKAEEGAAERGIIGYGAGSFQHSVTMHHGDLLARDLDMAIIRAAEPKGWRQQQGGNTARGSESAEEPRNVARRHEQRSRVRPNARFKEETNMSELRYPNESREYRDARDLLLNEEQELVEKVKSVAAKRRTLPLGGQLKEDYVFQWANDGKVGKRVK